MFARASLLLYSASWALDPIALGYLGSEGLVRWGASILCVLTAIAVGRKQAWTGPITLWFGALCVAAWLSLLVSPGTPEQYTSLLRLAPAISIYIVADAEAANGRSASLVSDLFLLLFAVTVVSLVQGTMGLRLGAEGRLLGLTPHPNVLGLVAVATAILAPRHWHVWRPIVVTIASVVVWWTGSTLALLTLAGWLGAWALGRLASAVAGGDGRPVAWSTLVALALVLTGAPLLLAQVDALSAFEWFRFDGSSYERLAAWRLGWNSFLENPLTGSGFASAQLVVGVSSTSNVLDYNHSASITHLGTMGLLGFACFVGLLATAVVRAGRMSRHREGAALAGVMFAVVMFSSVEAGLQQMPLSWFLFMLACGLARAAINPPVEEQGRLSLALPIAAQQPQRSPRTTFDPGV